LSDYTGELRATANLAPHRQGVAPQRLQGRRPQHYGYGMSWRTRSAGELVIGIPDSDSGMESGDKSCVGKAD